MAGDRFYSWNMKSSLFGNHTTLSKGWLSTFPEESQTELKPWNNFEQNDDYGKDIIRRFIGFIDIAYIEKVKIKFFMNNDDIQSLYNGEELLFLWDRTISRIEEMRDINDK